MSDARPLVISRDPDLLDDVHRLAVAAGCEADTGSGAAAARRSWSTASLVVVGSDVASEVARAGLPRRDGVVVVTNDGALPPWSDALACGADTIVALASERRVLLERLAESSTRRRARVVGVVGGCGGAGASVVACALAVRAARRGWGVVLVDTDPDAAGLDLLLAAEDVPGARWTDLSGASGRLVPESVRDALPSVHGVHLLAVDRSSPEPVPPAAAGAVLDALRGACDVLLVDLPRAHADLVGTLAPRCDEVLVVAPTDVRGATATRRTVAMVEPLAPLRLVARRRRRAAVEPERLADWLGVDLAAEIRDERGLTAAADRGEPPALRRRSRLGRTCDGLVGGWTVR
jgi:secretion/DNA translocation related CpaE-like protein